MGGEHPWQGAAPGAGKAALFSSFALCWLEDGLETREQIGYWVHQRGFPKSAHPLIWVAKILFKRAWLENDTEQSWFLRTSSDSFFHTAFPESLCPSCTLILLVLLSKLFSNKCNFTPCTRFPRTNSNIVPGSKGCTCCCLRDRDDG